MFIALNLVVRKQIFVCTVLLSLVLSLDYYRKLVSPLSKFRLHASFFCFEQKPIRILSQTQVELQEPPSRRVNILDIQGSGQKGQFSILFFLLPTSLNFTLKKETIFAWAKSARKDCLIYHPFSVLDSYNSYYLGNHVVLKLGILKHFLYFRPNLVILVYKSSQSLVNF